MPDSKRKPKRFWVLISIGVLILVMLIVGQTMSFINYGFTVGIGLQESVEVVGEMVVALNKAFGVGDTLIYIPLLTLGLIGLLSGKKWGLLTMVGALAITAYWPPVMIFFMFFAKGLPDFYFTDYVSYTIILSAITVYGLWGLWYIHTNYKFIIKD